MSLDLFQSNIDDAVNYAGRVSAPEMPSTFTDNFNDAWNKGYLTNQSISGEIRKTTARSQLIDEAIAKTGDQSFAQSGEGGGFDIAAFNANVAKHQAANPEIDLQTISDESVQARADDIGKRQLASSASFAHREHTTGGSFGQFFGSATAAFSDPVNLIAFPLAAPESLGILGTALAWGGIGVGSQTAIEALNSTSMARINPDYATSSEPVKNILEAGVGGAVLGGGIKGLANLWSRAKTGQWPRSVRDAGNVVESEAQIESTNPFRPPPKEPPKFRFEPDEWGTERPGEKSFSVKDNNGAEIAAVSIKFDGDTARIVDIYAPGGGKNSIGNAKLREILRQFQSDHPEIASISGERVTGAKVGGGKVSAGAGVETSIDVQRAVEGEAAHRTALNKAIDDLANGRPVDVEGIVTPEQLAALDDRAAPVLAAKDAAVEAQQAARVAAEEVLASSSKAPELPFAQTEAQARAEASTATLTEGVQNIARLAGHEMPAEEAAKIAARISQLNDPDRARAVLDEVFLRPQTIADTLPVVEKTPVPVKDLNTPTTNALRDELTPAKIEEARVHPDMEETVARDLDKLMLERPGLEVPTGVTVDAEGRTVPTTRSVESVVNEADNRLAAAKEIEACVGPYPSEAAE